MVLSDASIRAVVAPGMIDPKKEPGTHDFCESVSRKGTISYGVTSGGYDFRLDWFCRVFTGAHCPVIDPKRPDPRALVPMEVHTEPNIVDGVEVGEHSYVLLPPRGYMLGQTMEYLQVPRDCIVVVLTKSTYARNGIIVNCTPLEPGWKGITTLEIGNLNNSPAKVYINEGIAQGLFLRLDRFPEKDYAERGGKYQDQPGLTLSRV